MKETQKTMKKIKKKKLSNEAMCSNNMVAGGCTPS